MTPPPCGHLPYFAGEVVSPLQSRGDVALRATGGSVKKSASQSGGETPGLEFVLEDPAPARYVVKIASGCFPKGGRCQENVHQQRPPLPFNQWRGGRFALRGCGTESELKQLAKSAGGRWDPDERVWLVPYGKVKGTKLKKHIVLDTATND